MKLLLHIEATAELDAAVAWYEHEREGLGFEMLEEVDRAFAVILESPTTWPMARAGSNLRRFVLTRFPVHDHIFSVAGVAASIRRRTPQAPTWLLACSPILMK